MGKTITIRLPQEQERALRKRAQALGRTKSDLVRELIGRGLQEESMEATIGHLEGRLDLPAPREGWRKQIKDRNWR